MNTNMKRAIPTPMKSTIQLKSLATEDSYKFPLGNSSMFLAKLQNLHLNHAECKYKLIACFKRECDKMKYSQTNSTSINKGQYGYVCEAPHSVSYHTAQCAETHRTTENVTTMLCILDMGLCA